MAIPKFANRAWEKTTTTGTGSSIALSGAVDNAHFTFAEAGVQDGDVVSYVIIDGTNVELQRLQTYSASGPTLSRAAAPHMSKIGGTAGTSQINLSGNATVVLVPFAEDFVLLPDYRTVKSLGAVGDGVADDTSAFQAAATAGGVWHVPSGNYNIGSVSAGSSKVFWECWKVLNGTGTVPLALPGVQEMWFGDGKFFYEPAAEPDTYATVRIDRVADYDGGTPGHVSGALVVNHRVQNANVADFQWAIVGAMDNSASGGENVGVYGQGWKRPGAGPTWGICSEARDFSTGNPTSGLIALEAGIFANGPDDHEMRVAVNAPLGKANPSGPDVYAHRAFWVTSGPGATWGIGLQLDDSIITGINVGSTGERGIRFNGANLSVGIDLSEGTFSAAAIRLRQGQSLALDATGTLLIKGDGGRIVVQGGRLYASSGLAFPSAGLFSTSASAGSASLPSAAVGFLSVLIDGTQYKIPVFAP